MRRNFVKAMALAAALFGIGAAGSTSAKTINASQQEAKKDFNGITKQTKSNHRVTKTVGGIDMVTVGGGGVSMSPKQYGMIVGNGGSKRSNRLRYSHNAKLKRRMV